jgi:hypothetical protein
MYNYHKKILNALNICYFLPWGSHERHGQSRPAAIFFGFMGFGCQNSLSNLPVCVACEMHEAI